MIFPVLYAVLVWYLVLRWRRTWAAFLALAIGTGFLVLLGLGLNGYEYAVLPPGLRVTGELQRGLRLLSVLLWPYTFLVYSVGQFIAILPRERPSHRQCRRCLYDLRGLPSLEGVCPECGEPWTRLHCRRCLYDLRGLPGNEGLCPECGTSWNAGDFDDRPLAATPEPPATPPPPPTAAAEAPRSVPI